MLTYIVAAVAVAGTVLNVKRLRAGFGVWCATNLFWIIHNAAISEWAQAGIYCVNLALSAWGFIRWGKGGKEKST